MQRLGCCGCLSGFSTKQLGCCEWLLGCCYAATRVLWVVVRVLLCNFVTRYTMFTHDYINVYLQKQM